MAIKRRPILEILSSPLTPERTVSITTRSGRTFRFDISEYRIVPSSTKAEIDQLAARIVAEKYRYCEWDKNHPRVNVQAEISAELVDYLTNLVQTMKQYEAKGTSEGEESSPRFFSPLVHTTIRYPKRRSQERMKSVWAVFDNSGEVVATFEFSCRKDADSLAAKLSKEKGTLHYVQTSRQPMGKR